MNLRFGILTASDRCSRGERPDLSGPALVEAVTSHGWTVACTAIQPDDRELLSATLTAWAASVASAGTITVKLGREQARAISSIE